MDENYDNEFMPDQSALDHFNPGANGETPALTDDFWRDLDLSEQKASELRDGRWQREAVERLVKNDLAQKLQEFFILYYVTFFFFAFLGAFASWYFPELRQPDRLKMILVSNGAYFCFLMTLSFFYELKLKTKWYFTLGTLILLAWSPYIYEHFVMPTPLRTLAWLTATITVPFLIGFFTRFSKGKSLIKSLLRIR